jgi:SEC-C motif
MNWRQNMAKIKGHHPCPCGSGKRYRQCCGMSIMVPGTAAGPGQQKYGGTGINETGAMLHLLMPTRGAVSVETMLSIAALGWQKDDYARLGVSRATVLTVARQGVAEAREQLAEATVQGMNATPNAEHFVLWIDDDAVFSVTDITWLLAELRRNPDIAALSAYYSAKEKGHPGFVPAFPRNENGHESALRIPGVDFGPESIVEVPWIGLHCAIMRGEVLRDLKKPRFPFDEASGCGEDVGFSHRIRAAGGKLAVHAGIIVPHIDAETGERFIPNIGAPRA